MATRTTINRRLYAGDLHVQYNKGPVVSLPTQTIVALLYKKIIMFGALVVTAGVVFAGTPEVSDVVAKQRYPWNGLVDITCNVSGIDGMTNGLEFAVSAVMPDTGYVRRISQFWIVQNGARLDYRTVHTNGNYRLLWDATADFGQVLYSNLIVRVTTVKAHAKIQLWKNGPYWADTNIGAEEPWEYGYYFWWGDIIGYKRERNAWVATDWSSLNFSFDSSNTPTYNKSISTLRSQGWITAGCTLVPEHDAAHVHWGGKWRMPTISELSDLRSRCDWTWTTQRGVNGYEVRGRDGYDFASIFLPAGGYGFGTSLCFDDSNGGYWSSVPYSDNYSAWDLGFQRSGHATGYGDGLYGGQSVRPVQGFAE